MTKTYILNKKLTAILIIESQINLKSIKKIVSKICIKNYDTKKLKLFFYNFYKTKESVNNLSLRHFLRN